MSHNGGRSLRLPEYGKKESYELLKLARRAAASATKKAGACTPVNSVQTAGLLGLRAQRTLACVVTPRSAMSRTAPVGVYPVPRWGPTGTIVTRTIQRVQ